jgi:nucleotide-binding universal stress UspA family protein
MTVETPTSTQRMLVSFDGTAPSHLALQRAADIAHPGDAVHVVSVMPYPSADSASDDRAYHARLLEEARNQLAAAGIVAATIAAEGDTATEILAAAHETDATVIVMAIDRQSFPSAPGAITAEIVRHASCDVYIVYVPPRELAARPA